MKYAKKKTSLRASTVRRYALCCRAHSIYAVVDGKTHTPRVEWADSNALKRYVKSSRRSGGATERGEAQNRAREMRLAVARVGERQEERGWGEGRVITHTHARLYKRSSCIRSASHKTVSTLVAKKASTPLLSRRALLGLRAPPQPRGTSTFTAKRNRACTVLLVRRRLAAAAPSQGRLGAQTEQPGRQA